MQLFQLHRVGRGGCGDFVSRPRRGIFGACHGLRTRGVSSRQRRWLQERQRGTDDRGASHGVAASTVRRDCRPGGTRDEQLRDITAPQRGGRSDRGVAESHDCRTAFVHDDMAAVQPAVHDMRVMQPADVRPQRLEEVEAPVLGWEIVQTYGSHERTFHQQRRAGPARPATITFGTLTPTSARAT